VYPGGTPNPAENSGGSVLRWYAAVLRRRWKWVAIGVLAGLVGGLLSALAQHQSVNPTQYFKATNTLSAGTSSTAQNTSNLQQAAFLLNAEVVTSAIVKDLGVDPVIVQNQVAAVAKPEVLSVEVTAIDTDPAQAAKLADTAADELAKYWLTSQNGDYVKRHDTLLQKINDDQTRQQDLQKQIDAATKDPTLLAQLQDELTAADTQYRQDSDALTQLGTPTSATSTLTTLKPATPIQINGRGYAKRLSDQVNSLGQAAPIPPTALTFSETDLAISPGLSRLVRTGLGGVAGLVLGLAAAFLVEAWDDRIRRRDKLETLTGLPVLAEIPKLTKAQARDSVLVSVDSPRSRAAERYRAVRTSLLFALNEELNRTGTDGAKRSPVVLVTSPGPSEGKTTTTANLAATLGDNGLRVLVIDCDYHKPSIARLLSPVPDLERPDEPSATRLDGVEFIPAPHRDNQVLSAVAQLHETIEHWRDQVDLVLLDTPPMLTTNDATDLLAVSDVVVLVVRAGQTRSGAADRVMDLLVRFKAEPIGIVLNSADESDISALNYYGYGYGYYAQDADDVGPPPTSGNARGNGKAGPPNGSTGRPIIGPGTVRPPA
jgi:Mrp family chromosome partitioning ATPase/capsular polysaccharide biosynthesis protein